MKKIIVASLLIIFLGRYANADISFVMHVLKKPQPGMTDNTAPQMPWLEDVDNDGNVDILVSHIYWWNNKAMTPFVSWYKGPTFDIEYVIIDKDVVGVASRIYRFVMYDVDRDGKKDLIGQGYRPQPFHNGNKWYRCPDDPTMKWYEYYDYGEELKNGHDIRLFDVNCDNKKYVVLLDSHSAKIIAKSIPGDDSIKNKWPYYTITEGHGLSHHMSFFDVNGDGFEDIIIAKEEDGGDGIRWYEHPGEKNVRTIWKDHFEVDANFTKVFARDLDKDGDIDFIGTGEFFYKLNKIALFSLIIKAKKFFGSDLYYNQDFGWYERVRGNNYIFHEFDKKDNLNDIIGGHNCELVDVDGDGDEDLIVGGVDVKDMKQRFRWYERTKSNGKLKYIEHPLGVTSVDGLLMQHGNYCGDMTWGDIDKDGDIDLVYAGMGSGFWGWFENKKID